ncbi:MAG: integrase core domain-containing protein, partial [Spirochaetota bacterium]|nr:integrase core domain-containing protein [Spirochaetota bacterium]
MDGQGRVFDNILTERFFRSIKYEDIYINCYESMNEVKRGVRDYINYYNNKRLHQSLEHNTSHEI